MRLGAKDAVGQLFARHFQRKERHGFAADHRCVLRDVEHEGGFTHRRARADQDQLATVEARGQAVQLHKAGGHALHAPFVDIELFDVGIGRHQRGLDVHQRIRRALHRDVIDLLFCIVQYVRDGLILGIALVADLSAGADEAAQDAFFLHDAGVGLRVGRRGHGARQRHQVRRAADAFHHAAAVQLVRHRHQIHRPSCGIQRTHGFEKRLVDSRIKVVALEGFDRHHHGFSAEHHRAQKGFFRIVAVRRHAAIHFHRHELSLLSAYD